MRQNYRNKKAVKPIRKFYENEKDTVIADIEEDFGYNEADLEYDFIHDAFNALYPVIKRYKRLMDRDPLDVLNKQIDFIITRLEEVL